MLKFRALLRKFKINPVWAALAFSCLVLIVGWAILPQVAQATLESVLLNILGGIVGFFVSILGAILIKFIGILVVVAQFNNFIDAPAVKIGWSVTRDMANMFFIVALLVIAIGTMFRIDQYRYSRTLSKLIVMAILINFSKAIAGFFIDFSQVVMLTFVNAFKDQAAGSLSAGFGIDKLMTISSDISAAGGDLNSLSVVGSLFAALVMVFVATVVVAIFTILLIQRIIMLWIYIILAPTAYMVAVLPGSLGSWWGSWWRDFSQYLIKGPVIAFFLWLALTIITLSTTTLIPTSTLSDQQKKDVNTDNFNDPTFANEATTGTAIINYLVAIGLLIAGLQQAAKAGGAAGAVAGKWMGNFNKWGSAIATSPISAARRTAGYAGNRAGDLVKPTAYRVGEGALGLASKMNFLGIGAAARKQQASLRQQRLKAQDKDVSSAKFLDSAGEHQILLGSPATLSGQGYQKAAMENAMKTHGLRGYDDEQKTQILSAYEKHIGYEKRLQIDPKTGEHKFVEGAVDSDGLKVRKDLFKKSPGLVALRYDDAEKAGNKQEMEFYKEKMAKLAKSMSATEINDMEESDWTNKTWQKFAVPEFDKRLMNAEGKPSEFAHKVERDVSQSMQEAIAKARFEFKPTTGEPEVLAHEDVDRDRQRRTVALQKLHGDDFERSAEYLANPDQYYGKQQYAANLKQQERVQERQRTSEAITSMNRFSRGESDMLAVSAATLEKAGVKPTAGGYTRNPESVKRIAGVLNKELGKDLQDIESQLATVATQEGTLNTPSKVLGASGKPMTLAQANPEKLQDLQARRVALEARKATIQKTQKRLQEPESLQSLQFINADRAGVDARAILAEEKMHKNLDELDPNRTIRKDLRDSLDAEEFKKITDDVRKRSGEPKMTDDRAFDEYLTKGLVNRGRWGDKSADAIQLKSGLALALKEQQEVAQKAGGKKINLNVDNLDEVPDITIPPKAGVGRYVANRTGEAWDSVTRPFTSALEKRAAAERATNEQVAAQRSNQATKQTEDSRQALETSQAALTSEEQKLQQVRQKNSGKAIDYQKSYDQNQAIYSDKTKSRAERDRAYDTMGAYANSIESLKKQVTDHEDRVAGVRQQRDTHQAALQGAVGSASQAPAAPPPSARFRPVSSVPTVGRPPEAPAMAAPEKTAAPANVSTNITQNIRQAFKVAPADIRGKLMSINSDTLDSALKNSIVWRGLMSYIKSNTAEVQKSEKLGDVGREELQKRIGKLQGHMDEGNAEAFKNEFGELQNMFSGGGGSTESAPEA